MYKITAVLVSLQIMHILQEISYLNVENVW
jgi:hypothetical protein